MSRFLLLTPLAVALALGLGGAAASPATPDAERERELASARADLQRAARRVAELSGQDAQREVMVQRHLLRGPVLGVVLEADAQGGVQIAAVAPGSAAADAGLQRGDRLTSLDGKAIAGADGQARLDALRARLRELDDDTPVALGYQRAGRTATVKVTPRVGEPLVMLHHGPGVMDWEDAPRAAIGPGDQALVTSRVIRVAPSGVEPGIHREIMRIDRDAACPGDACRFALLEDAFRWNGLNLAALGPQLGRYFGSDRGVLVITVPDQMGGLQPGDVILKLDGKAVATPREAMAAVHAREPGTAVPVEYLRDRKHARTTVRIPERRTLILPGAPMPPPPPPAAPAAPRAAAASAPPTPPPAPPAAPAPANAPAAPPSPPAPPAANAPLPPPPPPPATPDR